MKTLHELSAALARGSTTSAALTDAALVRIGDPAGEGARAFLAVYSDEARAAARQSDELRAFGRVASPLAGIPVSIKDLFDVAGEVTRAGSVVLRDAAPAQRDAPIVARLRAAGAIIVGRTNMTEFAYGAHGINSHYGTPANPWDRASRRISGGSSSGAAVSLTDGMAFGAIGSDTGGSVRIPAALCGVAGFKPTQRRVPLAGAFPLSPTRDSIGPLANSAACCALLDAILAGEDAAPLPKVALKGLRLGLPSNVLRDALDKEVAIAFEAALHRISAAGAALEEFVFSELDEEVVASRKANFSGVEAYAIHRDRLATQGDRYDPRVHKRLLLGAATLAADYFDLIRARARLIESADRTTARFDAVLAPTSPIVAPRIADMEADEDYFFRVNGQLLRNCGPFNFLDRPALTLPCHAPGTAPVGLMLVGAAMHDRKVLAIGQAIEAALQRT